MPSRTIRYIGGRIPAIAILFIILVFTAEAAATVLERFEEWQVARIEQTEVFEYVAVEYVETTDDGLLMVSTAAWHQHVDRIEWVDRLDCSGTWSSQRFEAADREPVELRSVEWPYVQPYPTDGRECRMVSVISAEARGRVFVQQIESAPFIPGR